MKHYYKTLTLAVLLAFSLPAFAGSCPRDMKAIDQALAAATSISDADLARVKALRASGESKHKSGQHSESVSDLHEAMKILGI
jgi:hypothetical protein